MYCFTYTPVEFAACQAPKECFVFHRGAAIIQFAQRIVNRGNSPRMDDTHTHTLGNQFSCSMLGTTPGHWGHLGRGHWYPQRNMA